MTQRQPQRTPEFCSVLEFVRENQDQSAETWPTIIPFISSSTIPRVSFDDAQGLLNALTEGEGYPVVVSNALSNWQLQESLTFAHLQAIAAHLPVVVNDRAPARHADVLPGGGGAQRTKALLLGDYISYLLNETPATLLDGYLSDYHNAETPFYLNGWRAFLEVEGLPKDCPLPSFASGIDDTVALLQAIDARLFGATPATSTNGGSAWCKQVDSNLSKVFMGPPGTVTRLHYDAGDAHGWLAQITGRKLFILYPPSDSLNLAPLATEKETVQSPVDPLHPDVEQWPEYKQASPRACFVHPGEAILVPNGWWHYAVALDRSITVQRNFYHAASNASGLVQMVMKTAASLRQKQKQ